jgi:PKD repeat protein
MYRCTVCLNRVKWLSGLCFAVALLASASTVGQVTSASVDTTRQWTDNPFGVAVTRWVDPEGRKPIPYLDWRRQTGSPERFVAESVPVRQMATPRGRATKFAVIVNTTLYDQIREALDQYIEDLVADEYTVKLIKITGGTAEDMRSLLAGEYALGMAGCVLIGDLPIAWYESECWDEKEHEEFPCDLFYLDLDGQFTDTDADGIYDTHTGDITPEIWLGRLTASPLTMGGSNEVELLKNYFRKNHLYRTGRLPIDARGLVYIDDDWAGDSIGWNADVGNAYSTRTLVADPYTTWGPDYTGRLPLGYDFIEVCVHSSPWGHSFKRPPGSWSDVYNNQIKSIDPQGHFYNLYACSNVRFVETDYMGGWYVFCQTYGLAAVGSTKTGSMLQFGDFYTPFGQGKTIGEALSDWFRVQGLDGYVDWEVCWYYGMTLCGDPTLRKLPAVFAENALGPAPLKVDFTSDIGLPVTNCTWNFGDGQGASGQSVSHQYTQPGSRDVSVTMNTVKGAFAVTVPGLVSVYADTLAAESAEGEAGSRVSVDVNLHNYLEVGQVAVPFHWSGPLNLAFDSFSTAGLRTDYFVNKSLTHFSYSQKRATVTLSCSDTQEFLSPGDGPVLRLWFTIPVDADPGVNPIPLTAYLTYVPYLLAHAGGYEPVATDGSITYPSTCCFGPSVGNVDGSLDYLVTMSDLTVLIDHLFITLTPLACVDAGNVDLSTDELVTMSDLTVLIDHLFITLAPLPPCP